MCGEEVNSLPTCSLDGQTFRKVNICLLFLLSSTISQIIGFLRFQRLSLRCLYSRAKRCTPTLTLVWFAFAKKVGRESSTNMCDYHFIWTIQRIVVYQPIDNWSTIFRMDRPTWSPNVSTNRLWTSARWGQGSSIASAVVHINTQCMWVWGN